MDVRLSSAGAVLDASIGCSPASASPASISPKFHFSKASGAAWLLRSATSSTQRRTTSSSSQPCHRLTGVFVFVAE
jgi:hypothetical protein